MSERSTLLRLFFVSLLGGCNYVVTASMPAFDMTIYATVLGAALMTVPAGGEWLAGSTLASHSLWLWIMLALAGILNQGLAGFWWNNGSQLQRKTPTECGGERSQTDHVVRYSMSTCEFFYTATTGTEVD